MHDVQTLTRCLLPPGRSATRTVWMLGSHRRLVRRWECDTDLPKPGAFPQISQTAAIRETPQTLGPWAEALLLLRPGRPASSQRATLTTLRVARRPGKE